MSDPRWFSLKQLLLAHVHLNDNCRREVMQLEELERDYALDATAERESEFSPAWFHYHRLTPEWLTHYARGWLSRLPSETGDET